VSFFAALPILTPVARDVARENFHRAGQQIAIDNLVDDSNRSRRFASTGSPNAHISTALATPPA